MHALHAGTTRAAVALSRDLVPDALVLDLHLPDGDGFGIVEELRRDGRLASVPVVVYSASEVEGSIRDRLRLGQTVFLTKSRVSPQELEQRVLRLIGVVAGTERSALGVAASLGR